MGETTNPLRLTHGELLELRRWNTPTIYNGWEQITAHDAGKDGFNPEETTDFMPQMSAMIGYAITVVCQPSNPAHRQTNPQAWSEYRRYVASMPGPKIVVVQDLDKPNFVGSFWGEVNANVHRALDEMNYAGFKALAKRLCVGHAYSWPVRWDCEVEVFGRSVKPGQLIHADKHGFLVVPEEDEARLLEAARLMDTNECRTLIPAARDSAGQSYEEVLANLERARAEFSANIKSYFERRGEF